MRVKCLAQEHNTITWPRLEPGPLDPESSALTTKPPRLPHLSQILIKKDYEIKIKIIKVILITSIIGSL